MHEGFFFQSQSGNSSMAVDLNFLVLVVQCHSIVKKGLYPESYLKTFLPSSASEQISHLGLRMEAEVFGLNAILIKALRFHLVEALHCLFQYQYR